MKPSDSELEPREGALLMGQTRIARHNTHVVVEVEDAISGNWRRTFYTPEQAQQIAAQLLYQAKTVSLGRDSWGEQIVFAFTPLNGRRAGEPPPEEFLDV